MMLKLTIKDIVKQRTFGMIAIISGITLGVLYYFLTLEMALTHISTEIELLPLYMTASIGLTVGVAVLGGINIALVGFGRFGKKYHKELIKDKNFSLKAIYRKNKILNNKFQKLTKRNLVKNNSIL